MVVLFGDNFRYVFKKIIILCFNGFKYVVKIFDFGENIEGYLMFEVVFVLGNILIFEVFFVEFFLVFDRYMVCNV